MNTPTPHNAAIEGEIAKTVLMPGDPLRAKFIAENYLKNPKLYNTVRGMLGYTGTYKGKEVSVQGSGMGIPSIAIYSHELYNFYAVENIIRIGSAGAISKKLKIGDIVLGMAASTNSNYPAQFDLPGTYAPTASYELLAKAVKSAEELGISYKVGNIFSSDSFYRESASFVEKWESMGILAVEMEAAGLYCNAASAGKNALCILTISDDPNTGEKTTAVQRQNTFTEMMEVALNML